MSNVAFLNNSGGNDWGGVENWIFKTAKALKNRGHEVFIIARRESELYKKSKDAGLNTKIIKRISSATFMNPFRVIKLFNYINNNKIQALFFCSSPTFKLGTVAANLANVENIIYRRGSAKPIKDKFYNRLLLNRITCFIANSEATKNKSLKFFNDFSEEKVKLIYNGVDLDKYKNFSIKKNFNFEFEIDENKLLLVNIGRLSKQKGQEYLIKAINLVKESFTEFNLILIGTGPKENKLKKLVKTLNLTEYIKFAGFRKDIPFILSQADLMVHTALWEGCPWVVLESLASGVPILATDSSSLPEIIEEGKNGYLAKDRDIESIAKKIIMMCKDADLNLLSKGARESAEQRFSFERVIEETENIFERKSK